MWAGAAIGLPVGLFANGYHGGFVAACGAWFGALAVGVVGVLAIPQLVLMKASTEADVFLKVCAIIDDPKFADDYDLMLRNREYLKNARLTQNASLPGSYASMTRNIKHLLDDMEKIGIIFFYATNKEMISDYIGDVVILVYETLAQVITGIRKLANDATRYERFTSMYDYCKKEWGKTVPMDQPVPPTA
ncbi:MAG TPA: hypothetical protein VMA98_03115 [Candidatus Acidoferrales bacterium]|nr:hypothetical protein [Candidatus Acidoferrales bacterium]